MHNARVIRYGFEELSIMLQLSDLESSILRGFRKKKKYVFLGFYNLSLLQMSYQLLRAHGTCQNLFLAQLEFQGEHLKALEAIY